MSTTREERLRNLAETRWFWAEDANGTLVKVVAVESLTEVLDGPMGGGANNDDPENPDPAAEDPSLRPDWAGHVTLGIDGEQFRQLLADRGIRADADEIIAEAERCLRVNVAARFDRRQAEIILRDLLQPYPTYFHREADIVEGLDLLAECLRPVTDGLTLDRGTPEAQVTIIALHRWAAWCRENQPWNGQGEAPGTLADRVAYDLETRQR